MKSQHNKTELVTRPALNKAHHPDTVDQVTVLKTVYGQLQDLDWVENPQDITSAKVPIIKFRHSKTHLEADISLYNTLGQENTRLLR